MVDMDFDGTINRTDLKCFLLDVLRKNSKDILDPQIDRLFKLLDRYKRGYIQPDDFKEIFYDRSLTLINI